MTVNKITSAPTPNKQIEKINEIIDNLGGGGATALSDLTDVTLTSPASGDVLAYDGSGWVNDSKYLKNDATISGSIIISGGISQNSANAVALGASAMASANSVAIGSVAQAGGSARSSAIAIGRNAKATGAENSIAIGAGAKADYSGSIQLGYGENATSYSLMVGFYDTEPVNYKLIDKTGLIPDARLSSNIARTSDIYSRNIGEIVTSTVPLTDAGLHLLDGTLINGSGSYSDFVTYIAELVSTYPDLFTTEANWQTAVTTYDVCGKFVYDSTNNTVRLPKITGIVEGTTDLTALGDLVQAGLPNITGTLNAIRGGGDTTATSAFEITSSTSAGSYSSSTPNVKKDIKFDASLSDSIYGSSTTVQPQTIKVLYYIVVATSSKTDIQVDIDEIATDLNGKADRDFDNTIPSQRFKNNSINWVVPSYPDVITVTGTTTFIAPTAGLIYMRGQGNRHISFTINGQTEVGLAGGSATNAGWVSYAYLAQNDVCQIVGGPNVVYFYPAKGAN